MKNTILTSYTISLSESERKKLESIISHGSWETSDAPYAFWKAKKTDLSLVAYQSGKLTIQGKGTHDFVTFTLEPEVTGEVKLGYSSPNSTEENELPFPHVGIDESGKGDFFGPLVIAAVYVDVNMKRALERCDVKDSKIIKNDRKIIQIASEIRRIVKGKFAIVQIGPEAYNRLYEKIGNLNKLLAWGHARVLENVLEKKPDCNLALSDKFGNSSLIRNALLKRGKKISLHQKTKGESDIAVAAASILAREGFLKQLKILGESLDTVLPKGAGANVDEKVRKIVAKHGIEQLPIVGKMHFKTVNKALHE